MRMSINRERRRASIRRVWVVLTLIPALGLTSMGSATGWRAAPRSGVSVPSNAGDSEPGQVERETVRMGTRLSVRVTSGDRVSAVVAIERAFAEVDRVESRLSSWRPDSDLSRLNGASPGSPRAIPKELAVVLARAFRWRSSTDGAFDPAIGALVDAWDLRGSGRRPSEREIEDALAASGERAFSFDAERGVAIRRGQAAWIDAGGFGKGVALAAIRRVLRAEGVRSGFVDFGGQVLVFGSGSDVGGARTIGVAHPRHRDRQVASLRLRDASAATSGQSERFVDVNGQRFGHVLDPRSGRPVPAWGSVTVVARDPFVADVLSTALFVMGPNAGLAWVDAHPDVAALFLVSDGERLQARWSTALDGIVEVRPEASARLETHGIEGIGKGNTP